MLFISNALTRLAASGEISLYIYPNQIWTADSDNTDFRSKNYSYVYARNHAVHPILGTDNFSKIQVRVTDGYGLRISDIYTLKESATTASSIKIYEGYLNTSLVGFQFRGNSSDEAYAIVSYDGL